MTIDERFDRIEHVTAGLAEERRKDREENRQLWRDTQRQLNELTMKVADTNDAITRFAEESRAADRQLREEMRAADEQLRERMETADRKLGERIEALVSAIGKLLDK